MPVSVYRICWRINSRKPQPEAQADAGDWCRLLIVSCARWGQKRVQESDAALAELTAKDSETAAYQIAEAYAYRGDKDHAFEWLERARRQRDPVWPVCVEIRSSRIFEMTRDGTCSSTRWAWPTTK